MSYASEGRLTTDSREIAISETWDTQTDWSAFQSERFMTSSSGVLTLADNVSENYEHNDLSGQYSGDTSQFSIQTGTVDEGTYALEGADPTSHNIITRTTQQGSFNRYGLEMSWRQYQTTGGNGGIALMTEQQGISGNSGFVFQMRDDLGWVAISKVVSGSISTVDNTTTTVTTGQWVDCSLVMTDDGSINYTSDGTTVSISDTDYQSVYLGAHTYSGTDYIDDVRVGLVSI